MEEFKGQFGKREIMYVANWLYRRYSRSFPTWSDALKGAWKEFKSNFREFCIDLHDYTLSKRKEQLKGFDPMKVWNNLPNATHAEVYFTGKYWDEKYMNLHKIA